MSAERYGITLRPRILGRTGFYDRFWCVVDRERRNAMVAEINATMPRAEKVMRDYCDELNAILRGECADGSRLQSGREKEE